MSVFTISLHGKLQLFSLQHNLLFSLLTNMPTGVKLSESF